MSGAFRRALALVNRPPFARPSFHESLGLREEEFSGFSNREGEEGEVKGKKRNFCRSKSRGHCVNALDAFDLSISSKKGLLTLNVRVEGSLSEGKVEERECVGWKSKREEEEVPIDCSP